MIGMLAIVLTTNVTNLITNTTTRISSNNQTTTSCVTASEINIATNIIAIIMRVYLPFSLMVGFDWLVIKRLRSSKQRVGVLVVQMTSQQSQQQQQSEQQKFSKEQKFALATITIDLVFFVFYTPVAVNLTMNLVDVFSSALSYNTVIDAQVDFYSNVAQLIAFTYHSSGFFIFIGFNKIFRKEIFRILRIKRGNQNQNPTEMSMTRAVRQNEY
jgi:hypothetical protein